MAVAALKSFGKSDTGALMMVLFNEIESGKCSLGLRSFLRTSRTVPDDSRVRVGTASSHVSLASAS